jgi:type II secretory pathway component GspD/PulD (secretin)
MFALPALAAELPGVPVPRPMSVPVAPAAQAGEDETAICFEVRVLKLPAGFWRQAGCKPDGDLLSEKELRRLLEAMQADRGAAVMQAPKVTVADGETARISTRETRFFVTGVEATKVKGATVLVPKNMPVELGDLASMTGRISADGKSVCVQAKYTRTRVEGEVELVPIVTKITPVFEGGSQGKPVAFTQYIQAPDVRTEKVEKTATVPDCATVVLGGWKETEPATQGKKKVEYEVVVLATPRILRAEPPAMAQPVPPQVAEIAPMPRAASAWKAYPLKNASAQIVAVQLSNSCNPPFACCSLRQNLVRVTFDMANNIVFVQADSTTQQEIAFLLAKLDEKPHVYRLRNAAAADAALAVATYLKANKLDATVTAEPVSNSILVAANAELQKRIAAMLDGIDKAPAQVMLGVTVVQVPRGFTADAGLSDGKSGENAWALGEREARMLTAILRAAKSRGELEMLSRPMMQVADGQAGTVQIGQQYPVAGAPEVRPAGGAAERKVAHVPVGLTLRCTPKVAPDGKSLALVTEFRHTEVARGEVVLAVDKGDSGRVTQITVPAFNTQAIRAACDLKFGQTLVLSAGAGEKCETLLIITPHLVSSR